MPDNFQENLKIELYKQLKQEANTYVKEIPSIWLQKFSLIGAVVIFTLTGKDVSAQYNYLIVLGFVVIPFLALVLDAKVLEYSLHARVISKYIAKTFSDSEAVSNWEDLFWGRRGEPQEINLVRIRSLTTVVVQFLPTCILINVSAAILEQVQYGIIGSIIYLAATVIMWWLIFIRK
jgi:hypothetical protein